jgi:hypothetical protein
MATAVAESGAKLETDRVSEHTEDSINIRGV